MAKNSQRRRNSVYDENDLHVVAVELKELFGKISYSNIDLKQKPHSRTGLSVIYGDNGAGKTTLLNLMYCTLSNETRAGLRTKLARTPFRSLKITFSGDRTIKVTKEEGLVGPIRYTTSGFPENIDVKLKIDEATGIKIQPGAEKIHAFLDSIALDILFVDHERYVKSTFNFLHEAEDTDEGLVEWQIIVDPISRRQERKWSSKQFPLTEMVSAVNSLLRNQAYLRSEAGDQNASAVYLEITKALLRPTKKNSGASKNRPGLDGTLEQLDRETGSFVRHGLLSPYPFSDLRKAVDKAPRTKIPDIERALEPFVESVERRIVALRGIHELILDFETEINSYVDNKSATFHVLTGLKIRDAKGEIDLDALSSGEKQLLFLLSAAVISRGRRSLILIDEPELSLNYKWQRLIGRSLERLTVGGDSQFIMASHSIEIISQFGESSYELVNDAA